VLTTNGDACLASSGSATLDLFFKLVRGLDGAELERLFSRAAAQAVTPEAKADLVVLAFNTRGTRGTGKGEKALAYSLLALLAKAFGPEAIVAVLGLLPAFGYWKDLVHLLAMDAEGKLLPAVAAKCEELLCDQLLEDEAELAAATAEKRTPSLSLAAKYAPREGTSFDKKEKGGLAKRLARKLFGGANPAASARKYRKLCSTLNQALNTTECLMAAGRWEEIRFARVASLCLQRHRKAFLNEKLKGKLTPAEELTGNRHPDDATRVAARVALRKAIVSKKGVQGKALMPHEIVSKCMRGNALSTVEADLLDAQWTSMRTGTLEAMTKAAEEREKAVLAAAAPTEVAASATASVADALGSLEALKAALPKHVDLGKLVALVDVSGSMSGVPMQVAIALGILVAELTAPTFRHRVLTFESHPQWVDLSECASIQQKVSQCQAAPWGGSTDFEAACERILQAAERARLKPDEIPDLIVFSDMQFNEARGGYGGFGGYGGYGGYRSAAPWETTFERIQRRFAEVGRAICGAPYPAPRIIFWNLRGNTVGFPVTRDAPNVQMLSGFSPALLKLVIAGADLVAEEQEVTLPDGSTKVVRSGPTPEQTLRTALDDAAFDVVRLKLAELETGAFKEYDFAAKKAEVEEVQDVVDDIKATEAEDAFEVVEAD